jgi:hypothetical protein
VKKGRKWREKERGEERMGREGFGGGGGGGGRGHFL